MDQSSPESVRTPRFEFSERWEKARSNALQGRAATAKLLQHVAQQEKLREINEAFEAGRRAGSTQDWISGAKIGAFCGLLVGLAAGCAGGMFWMAAGFAAK